MIAFSIPLLRGPDALACTCGSGRDRYPLADARGIFCKYVCEECEDETKKTYRPEIFESDQYEADDLGDDDGCDDCWD